MKFVLAVSVMVAAIFLVSVFAVSAYEGNDLPSKYAAKGKNDKVRVISQDDAKSQKAIDKGCSVARQTKGLKAFICDSAVASELGLREDFKIFAMDTAANKQIGATDVQVNMSNTGNGTKIAILDTGYNYNHPELASSYAGGKDFVNDDDDPIDDNGHGSHVAGIITSDGVSSKSRGVAPDAQIISAKVLSSSGSGYFSDAVAAIYWAIDGDDGIAGTSDDPHPDAISMSFGTAKPMVYTGFCNNVMPSMTDAIKYARSRGVPVVAAAGNFGSSGVSLPGCINYTIAVGSVNGTDKIASSSSKGKAVDITAPGVKIYSTWLGTGYKTLSGTSMATPMVAGTIALIKSAHPAYTVTQVQNSLYKTAKDLGSKGYDKTYGNGRVRSDKAVTYPA